MNRCSAIAVMLVACTPLFARLDFAPPPTSTRSGSLIDRQSLDACQIRAERRSLVGWAQLASRAQAHQHHGQTTTPRTLAACVAHPASVPRLLAKRDLVRSVLRRHPFASAAGARAWTLRVAESEPVDAAADALTEAASFPWYDAETDGLRPVPLPPYQPPIQSSDWEWTPPNPTRPNWPSWLQFAVRSGLALILFGLLLLLLQYMKGRSPWSALRGRSDAAGRESEADRIEDLPFPIKRPQTDLLGEARRHYAAGRYGEAVIYLFSYQLVQLDRNHFIQLTRGKTNRQYLQELPTATPLRQTLYQTMVAFEDVFFGKHALSRERFEACWNRLDEFHHHVQLLTEQT